MPSAAEDLGLGHALAGGLDLPVFAGIVTAAAYVESDRGAEVAGDSGEVPASRVAAVLGDKPRRAVEERRPVPAGDRRPQLGELGRDGM
jgi:hypothetical protein